MWALRVALYVLIFCCLLPSASGQASNDDEMIWLKHPRQSGSHPLSSPPTAPHFEAAQAYESRGEYRKAIAEYRTVISLGGQTIHCLFLANVYLKLHEPQVAERTVLECLKLDESSVPARLSRAFILQEQNKYHQAEEVINQLLTDAPENPYVWYLSGRNYLGMNQPAQAEPRLWKSIQQDPQLAAAYFRLGALYSQKKSTYDRARQCLEQTFKLGYTGPQVHKELGSIYLKLDRLEDAVRHLKTAVRLDPSLKEAYFLLNRAHLQAGNRSQAEKALLRFQELQTETSQADEELARAHALYQKGVKLLGESQLNEALRVFQQALGRHALNDVCYYGIAKASFLKVELDRATEAIKKAIDLRSYETAYHYLYAQILQQTGKIQEAIAATQEAIALSPASAEFHDYLGKLYLGAGDYDRASSSLRKAVQLESENPYFHLNLSEALHHLGHLDESAKEKQIYLNLLSAARKRPSP